MKKLDKRKTNEEKWKERIIETSKKMRKKTTNQENGWEEGENLMSRLVYFFVSQHRIYIIIKQ